MTLETDLSTLVARTGTLVDRQGAVIDANTAFVAGSANDPDSFDANGLKVGPLGYYPFKNLNGDTVYMPCQDRIAATYSSELNQRFAQGASSIPALGLGVDYDENNWTPTGVQAVIGIGFKPLWPGTEAELVALIKSNPVAAQAYEDSARLTTALKKAIKIGYPLAITGVVYVNDGIDFAGVGRAVQIVGFANAVLVGGPHIGSTVDIVDGLLKIANSSSSGGTPSRSLTLRLSKLRMNAECMPNSIINPSTGNPATSNDLFTCTGFYEVVIEDCDFYAGPHFRTGPGGDAGLFISANRFTVARCTFQGFKDLGLYISGSSNGAFDYEGGLLIGNRYYYCSNGWAAKRNYQNLCSIGEYFVGCFNALGVLAATGEGDGLLAGSRITVSSPRFKDIVRRAIDVRGSNGVVVTGALISGTTGKDLDANQLPITLTEVDMICIENSTGCQISFALDVSSTAVGHSAVRCRSGSTGNVVTGSVKGIYWPFRETGVGGSNDVMLTLLGGHAARWANPDNVSNPLGTNTRYRWTDGDQRGDIINNIDRTPGRTPFTGLNTASFTFAANSLGRILLVQPGSTSLSVIPSSTYPFVSGDRVGVMKAAGSGTGLILFRDSANVNTLARLFEVGDIVWMVWDGTTWRADSSNLAIMSRDLFDANIRTADATLTVTSSSKIIRFQPGSVAVAAIMGSDGRNGDTIAVMKSAGSGSGPVQIRNTADTVTLATLYQIGDIVFMTSDGAGNWLVTGRCSTVINAMAELQPAANKIAYFTSATGAALADFTAAARTLLAASDQAGQRSALGLGTAAMLNSGTSGATVARLDGANTWSATQTFSSGSATITSSTGQASLQISAPSGFPAYIDLRTQGSNVRWRLQKTSSAEEGSNSGADVGLYRYSDAGTLLGTSIFIRRSTGVLDLGGSTRPNVDNSFDLGSAALRWKEIFCASNIINTSDEREKHWLRDGLTDPELRAGRRIIAEFGFFQWHKSIEEKGDAARWHFGVRAQRVFAILDDEGLDWHRYAWCCYDQWSAEDAVTEPVMRPVEVEEPYLDFEQVGVNDAGDPIFAQVERTRIVEAEEPTGEVTIVKSARTEGDLYGVRTDQLTLFLMAVQAAEIERINQRLDQLEAA